MIIITYNTWVVAFLKPFLQAVHYRKSICREEYAAWLKWLNQSDTTLGGKRLELCRLDKENGLCAMHYAARDYCLDILDIALMIQGGKQRFFCK